MKQVRLGTVALSSVLLFSACAHQQEVKVTPRSIQSSSLGWPLPQTPSAEPARERDPAPEIQLSAANSVAQIRSVPPRQMAAISIKPKPIKIPRAKNADLMMDPSFETPLIFDIPVAYNSRVKFWIEYFQTDGRGWFTKWLERSSRYLPTLQKTLKRNGLP